MARALGLANHPEAISVDSSNNVGIGTSSPVAKLQIDNAAASHALLNVHQLNASFNTDISLYNQANTTSTTLISKRTDGGLWLYQSGADYIAAYTSGSERMRINGSGHMTKADQPLFVGRLDTNSTTSTNYTISVSQIYNRSMSFNSSTDRITVPTTGYYMVHAQQLYESSGGIYLRVQINGATKMYGYGNMGSTHRDLIATGIWYLNANDYVDFFLQGTSTYAYGGTHSLCYVQLVQ